MKQNMKIGRNVLCPCGSGKKYKKCCLRKKKGKSFSELKKHYSEVYNIRLKDPGDIEGIRKAGRLVVDTLDLAESEIKSGVALSRINKVVHDFTLKNSAVPAPLDYRGFPKSVCTSVNNVVCHGIPDDRVLADGDIVNIDVTSILGGYYADASKTFFVGEPGRDAKKIVEVSKNCLKCAMKMMKPGRRLGDIGWAVQRYAEGQKCSVVRDFVGHGVGFDFHESPQVLHFGKKRTGVPLTPGMVFTVEPMINLGAKETMVLADKWTAVTKDDSLSAQFEQTFLITDDGYESLTPYEL